MLNAESVVFVTGSTKDDYVFKYSFLAGKVTRCTGFNDEDFEGINFTGMRRKNCLYMLEIFLIIRIPKISGNSQKGS